MLLDDDKKTKNCGRYFGVGNSHKAEEISGDVIVAIGDSATRERIQEGVEEGRLATLTHTDAVIAEDTVIGRGTIVMAGVVINHGSVIATINLFTDETVTLVRD